MYKKTLENIELVPFNDVSFDIQMETRGWRNKADVGVILKYPRLTKKHTKIGWLVCRAIARKAWLFSFDLTAFCRRSVLSFDFVHRQIGGFRHLYHERRRQEQRIGTTVLKKMIRYAADVMRFRRLFPDVLASNERAIAVYEDCGFAPTGENDGDFCRYVLELS